jgi:hypothetical protein
MLKAVTLRGHAILSAISPAVIVPGATYHRGPPTKKVKNRLVQLGAERFLLGAMMLILLPR